MCYSVYTPYLNYKALTNNKISIVLLSHSWRSTVLMNLHLHSEQPTLWLLTLLLASGTAEDRGWKMRTEAQLSGLLMRLLLQSLQSICCLLTPPLPWHSEDLCFLLLSSKCLCPFSSCIIPLQSRAYARKWLHSRDHIFTFLLAFEYVLDI